MEEIKINAHDGYRLFLNVYDVENPKAVIQIAHGMEEHQGRYKAFAEMLNAHGFAVISADMRGHGKMSKTLGFFKRREGYNILVDDHLRVIKFIKNKYIGLPVYLFAHSMGSIIARVVLQKHSKKYDKVILSGYPNYRASAKVGIKIADNLTLKHGSKYKSKFMTALEFEFFNFFVWNSKTSVDWISHDKSVIDEYLKDPLCGFGFTSSAFSDLFNLVVMMHDQSRFKNVKVKLPILFIRGTEDPSTGGKQGSKYSVKTFEKAGFKNITKIDYEKMRHELINEIEKEKVYEDILKFLND